MSRDELETALLGENTLVAEGGKRFPNAKRIKQENVKTTLDYIFNELLPQMGIEPEWVKSLGSTGKKLPGGSSGDIDIGIDASKVDWMEGCNNAKELSECVDRHCGPILDKLGLEHVCYANLFSFNCPIQDVDGTQEGQFVQVDMMPTRSMDF